MRRPDGRLVRLARLRRPDRRVVCEAALLLSCASLARRALPRRWLARVLTAVPRARPIERTTPPGRLVALLEATSAGLPFGTSCLDRALAARWMLARRNVRTALVVGATSSPFSAHAWLEIPGVVAHVRAHRIIWRHE